MGVSDAPDPHDDAVTVATTNYLGGVSILRLVATRMTAQGQRRVVVLSSSGRLLPRAGQAAYASAKAGLDWFARGLALELYGSGVDVTIVRPGFVHSPMTRGLAPAPYATTRTTSHATSSAASRGVGGRVVSPMVRVIQRPPECSRRRCIGE